MGWIRFSLSHGRLLPGSYPLCGPRVSTYHRRRHFLADPLSYELSLRFVWSIGMSPYLLSAWNSEDASGHLFTPLFGFWFLLVGLTTVNTDLVEHVLCRNLTRLARNATLWSHELLGSIHCILVISRRGQGLPRLREPLIKRHLFSSSLLQFGLILRWLLSLRVGWLPRSEVRTWLFLFSCSFECNLTQLVHAFIFKWWSESESFKCLL